MRSTTSHSRKYSPGHPSELFSGRQLMGHSKTVVPALGGSMFAAWLGQTTGPGSVRQTSRLRSNHTAPLHTRKGRLHGIRANSIEAEQIRCLIWSHHWPRNHAPSPSGCAALAQHHFTLTKVVSRASQPTFYWSTANGALDDRGSRTWWQQICCLA